MPVTLTEVDGIPMFLVTGVYSVEDMGTVVRHLKEIEARVDGVPDRIFDLSGVVDFGFDYAKVSAVARDRVAQTYRNAYRSAFVAPKPVQQGFTRMYLTLAANPSVEFASFPTLEKAVAWVKSPKKPKPPIK